MHQVQGLKSVLEIMQRQEMASYLSERFATSMINSRNLISMLSLQDASTERIQTMNNNNPRLEKSFNSITNVRGKRVDLQIEESFCIVAFDSDHSKS